MPYYGHRCGIVPRRLRDAWWVCSACLPEFVPACGICSAPAPVIDRQDGFVGYAYGRLCPSCVAKVQAAGPWRERRAQAVAAREAALLARFPGLAVIRRGRSMVTLAGTVEGRRVQVRLRISAREGSSERYIFHVQDDSGVTLGVDDLGLPEALRSVLAHDPIGHVRTEVPWLRVAFAHLGKLDTVTALELLVARTRGPAG